MRARVRELLRGLGEEGESNGESNGDFGSLAEVFGCGEQAFDELVGSMDRSTDDEPTIKMPIVIRVSVSPIFREDSLGNETVMREIIEKTEEQAVAETRKQVRIVFERQMDRARKMRTM